MDRVETPCGFQPMMSTFVRHTVSSDKNRHLFLSIGAEHDNFEVQSVKLVSTVMMYLA